MLIIGGRRYGVPGFAGASFREDPKLGLALARSEDCKLRAPDAWVRQIVLHTRMGLPVVVRQGKGPNLGWDLVLARRFAADDRQASCHVAIDADGSYCCLADLKLVQAYHAEHLNASSVGIELYQGTDGSVSESTMDAAVAIVDVITRIMGIQRQYPLEHVLCRRLARATPGPSSKTRLAYVKGGGRGLDFVGVVGHRNITKNRGEGDPGTPVFERLRAAGYEGYKIDDSDDLDVWSERQAAFGMEPEECSGVPDRKTRERLSMSTGRMSGLWIVRPGDDEHDGDGLAIA